MLFRSLCLTVLGMLLTIGKDRQLELFNKHKIVNQPLREICQKQFCQSRIDSLMNRLADNKMFNGVLLVAEQGKVVYKKAFGYVRKDSAQQFDTTYCMQLASVSKPITAIGVLILVEQGKLSLDDDIKKWFPKLPYKNITVKNLLQHTSGLPDYINDEYVFYKHIKNKQKIMDNQDLIDLLEKKKIPLRFTTGKKFGYSNTGYALLATIVEKVSGMTFQSYMKKYVFEPANMKHSFIYDKSRTDIALIRKDYREGIVGAKNVYSTVDDLLKLDQALYQEKLLKNSTLQSAYAHGQTNKAEQFEYGFGWRIKSSSMGDRLIYHRGLWEDANPIFVRFVDCNRTIISLNHPTRYSHWYVVGEVEKILNESNSICNSL